MQTTKHINELDVDFIISKPLTEKEKLELSNFITKLKLKNKRKIISKKATSNKLTV